MNNYLSIVLDDFHSVNIRKMAYMPIIAIYDKPKDFPEKYVARLFDSDNPTRYVVLKDSLKEVRQALPQYMQVIPRNEDDDSVLIETWL